AAGDGEAVSREPEGVELLHRTGAVVSARLHLLCHQREAGGDAGEAPREPDHLLGGRSKNLAIAVSAASRHSIIARWLQPRRGTSVACGISRLRRSATSNGTMRSEVPATISTGIRTRRSLPSISRSWRWSIERIDARTIHAFFFE